MPGREPGPWRKLDDVWVHFVRHAYKEGYQGECLACKDKILGKKHLLRKHLTQCPQVGEDLKVRCKEDEAGGQICRQRPTDVPGSPILFSKKIVGKLFRSSATQGAQAQGGSAQGGTSSRHQTHESRGFSQFSVSGELHPPYLSSTLPSQIFGNPEFIAFCQALRGKSYTPPPANAFGMSCSPHSTTNWNMN